MFSLRYLTRLILAYLSRFKGIIFLGIILGFIIFIFFRFVVPTLFISNIKKIGLTGRYRIETLPNEILEMVGQGLTDIDEKGNVIPAIAHSWETPDKGKTWIFQIKDGVFWQDGEKLTNATVNYQLEDVTVEKPEGDTIVFRLQEPFSLFPTVVSIPIFKKGLLGTGEWKVTKISLGPSDFIQKLVMVNKNKEKLTFKFFPTEEQTKLAFKLGKVDEIQGVFNKIPFENWPTVEISQDVNKNRVVSIFFNTQDELLSDKTLRQALAYSIEKGSKGPRAISPISPNSWAYNPTVKAYNKDAQRAEELIDDLANEIKDNLSIKLVTTPVLLSLAEEIEKEWEAAGVETQVLVSSTIPTEFQAFLAILDIPTDPDQYAVWHSTQTATNISRYKSPRIDKLLEDGRVELDIEERRKIYLDFQRFLVEDSPAIFLYHPALFNIERL